MTVPRILLLIPALLFAQVPDAGTRHDHRSSYLELGLSGNIGLNDFFRPQVELMAKHRGWPVFASGRLGLGAGEWLDHPSITIHPQLGLHWTSDGDNSWGIRLGWVMGEWIGTKMVDDTLEGHSSYAGSQLLGNTLAIERTAYFGPASNLAWRIGLGAATAWHQYEYRGAPVGEKTTGIGPYLELGLVWTSF